MTLHDAQARARIEQDLDTTLVVEAAAGTGKTTALIGRIVAVLRAGRASLERIVAVTFTEKAAGEMKLRLRAALGRARDDSQDASERAHLERALAALELAHINTIHGFCADLLRERPLEAGVDPSFEVLDESAADNLLQEAFDDWFEHVLAAPPEGVRRALRRRGWRSERAGPREQLLRACRELAEHRDFETAWSLPAYDRRACIDALVRALRELGGWAARAKNPRDRLAQALAELHAFSRAIELREHTRARDYDGIEAELTELARARIWKASGSGRLFGDGVERGAVLELRDATRAALDAFLAHAEADLAAKLQRELADVVAARERLKRRAGVLDFVDLLLYTRDLLRDDKAVRHELQQRFSHIFVDEFQDTDPLQADIVLLLAGHAETETSGALRAAPGKLFVVGDPKQSVYRFRRADVLFYERVKQQLLAAGAQLLHLTTSFRSLPTLQTAVNAAFSRLMTGAHDGSQAEYVPLSAYRTPLSTQPALVALPVPAPYGWNGLTKRAVEGSFPEAAAAFVQWLLRESGWTVEEAGQPVAVQAHHVCLLFRRFQSFGANLTRGYVRALEARRIPHVLLGGRSLHGREEIIALRAALTAIEWPDDELHVYATLRGPLFAIADEELLCFCNELGPLHPLARIEPAESTAHAGVLEALGLLRKLHRLRNQRPIADTIAALLEATRAHAGFAIWPTGEQALANVLGLVDAARVFETRGATSFRAFVDWLDDQAERDESGDAPIIEEGTEGVRLMTVHKAKGLEFPIVVLCDPTAPITPNSATRYVDPARGVWAQRLCGCRPRELLDQGDAMLRHESAENVRLAYVAATRARDLLVVPVFGDARAGRDPGIGWVDTLAPALYPADATRRAPRAAAGCPGFGADSVRTRSADARETPEDSVAPGLHLAAGGVDVVWWDPNVLELGVHALGGIRQQELLIETEASGEWLAAHESWREERNATLARAATPTLVARTITELAIEKAESESEPESEPESAAPPVPIERTSIDRTSRPRGARFGSLVHATLAYVPLDADAMLIRTIAKAQSRLIDATPEELEAAVAAVIAALAHPLMQRAAAALELRREVSVAQLQPDGVLAEGVIDLAFRESHGWTVIDFKTDAELTHSVQYAEQVRLYVEAVRAATGLAATGLLFAV